MRGLLSVLCGCIQRWLDLGDLSYWVQPLPTVSENAARRNVPWAYLRRAVLVGDLLCPLLEDRTSGLNKHAELTLMDLSPNLNSNKFEIVMTVSYTHLTLPTKA